MAKLGCSVLLVALLLESVLAANCSVSPIYVDIHKRAVTHGMEVEQYGSFIGVGNPFQNQSLWPSLRRNETSFAALDFCAHSNLTDCVNSNAGSVDFNASTSFQENPTYSSKDSQDIASQSVKGTDDIHLFTHYFTTDPASQTLVQDVPVEFAEAGDVSPGIVGIGSSSTMLERLVQLGLIAGKTYSLYIGSGMDRAGGVVNGSNVFGGYDAGRFKAPVHTYQMNISNPDYLPVTITDITFDDPTNSNMKNISILDNGQPFTARITTDQYPMLFPYQVTQNFASLLSASSSSSADKSLRLANQFNGTMTIHMGNFSIVIPSEVLSNATNLTPIQENDDKSDSGPFYLSTSFLTQVYLMMDFETSQFHLAEAIAKNNYVMPRTFCPGTIPVAYSYAHTSTFLKNGVIGAVIGGVIGGCAIITLLSTLFVFWRRAKFAKDQEKRWAAESGEKGGSEMEILTPRSKMRFLWGARKATPQKVYKLPDEDVMEDPAAEEAAENAEREKYGAWPPTHPSEDTTDKYGGWGTKDTQYGGRGM